jgi:hypothetical protein
MKNSIGKPLQKLEMDAWSTTSIFGDFKLQFKSFEFRMVKQLYTEMNSGSGALEQSSRAER